MKYIIPILLLTMILLVGCASFQDTKTLNSATPIKEKITESPSWLTYSNEKYNIKIDYPSDWRQYEEESKPSDDPHFLVQFSKDDVNLAVLTMPSLWDSLDELVKVSIDNLDMFEGFSLVESTRTKLSEYDAQRIIYTAVSKKVYFRKVSMILLIKGDNIYNIKFKAMGDDKSVSSYDENIQTVEKMIDSLRI